MPRYAGRQMTMSAKISNFKASLVVILVFEMEWAAAVTASEAALEAARSF